MNAPRAASLLGLLAVAPGGADAEIAFTEVSASAGLTHVGFSFGAAWGDWNDDGRPDLWTSNHFDPPTLYRNDPGGTFSNVSSTTIVTPRPLADMHGAAWADFDNDGDLDLYQTVGAVSGTGSGPKQLFVNDLGKLTDRAQEYGLAYPLGRGRTPLWFDYDRDGRLDVLLANLARPDGLAPTALFRQGDAGFEDRTAAVGLDATEHAFFAQLTATGPARTSTVLIQAPVYPQRALAVDSLPFYDQRSSLGLGSGTAFVKDVAVADFDGDLRSDLFLTRTNETSAYHQTDPLSLRASLVVNAAEQGIEFETAGNVALHIGAAWRIATSGIFIGANGTHPARHDFILAASDPGATGIAPHEPGVDAGVYLGRQPGTNRWRAYVSHPGWIWLDFDIRASAPISAVSAVGFNSADGAYPGVMLGGGDGGYVDRSAQSGVTTPTACNSVAAGDLDNDRDVDLFLVCTNTVRNLPDILLENLGSGVFDRVALAGGAEGSGDGRGDSVTLVDYDQDGFLDLFVTNGNDQSLWSRGGPDQLFRNRGNANHWLELDLEGVGSNRDGIGARVTIDAGGVQQLREQAGGMHRHAQDHPRIHFGLGPTTRVEQLTIEWPSGQVQRVTNLPADQIVRAIEPSAPELDGSPDYAVGVDAGVYLWREPDGLMKLRVNGGSATASYRLRLLATVPPVAVSAVGLEQDDGFLRFANGCSLTARVTAEEDGIDFRLAAQSAAMLAVERDGKPAPRALHVGPTGALLAPVGYVMDASAVTDMPAFVAGTDLGLFLGRTPTNVLMARRSRDAQLHDGMFALFSSLPFRAVTPVLLTPADTATGSAFTLLVRSRVDGGANGADVALRAGATLGVLLVQDGLVQPQRIEVAAPGLGLPNAFLIKGS